MEFTKEYFEDFIKRLHHHNRGEGVKDHGTSVPLFTVQKLERIHGMDSEYSDRYVLMEKDDHETEYEIDNDGDIRYIVENMDDEERKFLFVLPECETIDDFLALPVDRRVENLLSRGFERVYVKDLWIGVNSHFTKEGAEAFIERKKHDYRELRVYVESEYHCWEFNAIVKALLDGRIGYIEKEES